jgi:hypothetical protein
VHEFESLHATALHSTARYAPSFILGGGQGARQGLPLVFGEVRMGAQETGIGRLLDDNSHHVSGY